MLLHIKVNECLIRGICGSFWRMERVSWNVPLSFVWGEKFGTDSLYTSTNIDISLPIGKYVAWCTWTNVPSSPFDPCWWHLTCVYLFLLQWRIWKSEQWWKGHGISLDRKLRKVNSPCRSRGGWPRTVQMVLAWMLFSSRWRWPRAE